MLVTLLYVSKQWGVGVSSASGTTTLTYHLAYSNFAAVFTGNTSGDKSTSPVNMTNVGLSSCRIHVKDDARYYADSFNWFALGFQQWGYTGEQSNKITFALSYPKAVLGIMVTTGDGIPQNPVDVTLSGATAVGYNSAGCKTYWLAYGIQQWGKSLTAESKASVTFPIAFERIVYFVDVFSLDAGRPCLFTKSHPITTNGFYWEYNYHGDDVGVQWLAIGV